MVKKTPPLHEEREILLRLHNRGFKHCSVAGALGVSRALVSMWFNGKRKASEDHLTALRNMEYWTSYHAVNKIFPRVP
jgi:predicted transcriptional regulator